MTAYLLAAAALCASLGAAQAQTWKVPQAAGAPSVQTPYKIGPLDKLNITVFQVKELTLEKVQVDAAGQILLPLVGVISAKDMTTTELSADIAARLAKDFLQSPQVSVIVEEAASQKVTVDGSVTEAGVYQLKGQTSLIQALAMAKGPARDAKLKEVVIFRNINGQRQAAQFDVVAIRKGTAPDPQILGDDVVVVPGSATKRAIREVLGALPGLAIFRPY